MGRIKTTFVKTIAKDLFEKHSNKFTTNFLKNKEIVKELIKIKSKRMRNVIVGYITKLKKQERI